MNRTDGPNDPLTRQMTLGLGWFSIGLGMAELLAPREMARLVGVEQSARTPSILRAFGLREIGAGLAILTQPHHPAPLWSRVAGDAVDLAYLGSAYRSERGDSRRTAAAAAAVLGVTVLDILLAQRLGTAAPRRAEADRDVHVRRAVTVNRPIEQVYAFWRRFENLPRFMRHLTSVEQLDGKRSHWKARGPAGIAVQWDADITDERDGEHIAWRSVEGSDVDMRGSVRFAPAPGARGTELHVQIDYRPPAGALGHTLGWLWGRNPEQQLNDDLRRFKQLLETGEITVSDGPGLWRPAQPSSNPDRVRSLAGVER